MRLLDYSWGLVTDISGRDHESLKLLLRPDLEKPVLTSDEAGIVLKVPYPRVAERGFYKLQGMYFDPEMRALPAMWRLYRASLYHGALHAAYSDFARYGRWARHKELTTATFVASLVEDFRVTMRGLATWPGIAQDLAFANFLSASRVKKGDGLPPPERFATRLLLSLWGAESGLPEDRLDSTEAGRIASAISRAAEDEATQGDVRTPALLEAADEAYASLISRGALREVPSFPHTESHGFSSIFDGQVVEAGGQEALEKDVFLAFGLNPAALAEDEATVTEAGEMLQSMKEAGERTEKIRGTYTKLMKGTRLHEVEFPAEDYSGFMRVRASLAGPIKNIRDQLRQVRNVADETDGHESGQLDTQAALQVVASGDLRTDVFFRDEPVHKNEAWSILIDASKSTLSMSQEVRGIGTCLAEVARQLVPAESGWAMYTFNSALQVIKDFEEEFTNETRARIGGIEERDMTLLPDAMTVCNRALSARPVDTRIMVVVSDGYPAGYKGIHEALLASIKQVKRSGTLLMGLGIDSHAVEQYFAVNSVISSPYQMMKSFVRSYLELSSLF